MILYELAGSGGVRYSQFSWRSRMALTHKKLDVEIRAIPVTDKAIIAFSGQDRVPILVSGDAVVTDSSRIANHLEDRFPDGPSLFGGEAARALTTLVVQWTDRTVVPSLLAVVAPDVVECVDAADARHLRAQFERIFGMSLEDLASEREERAVAAKNALAPFRAVLRKQLFLSGNRPAYADFVLFSAFQWVRLVSLFEPLEEADPIHGWREAMLDLFGGLARSHLSRRERDI